MGFLTILIYILLSFSAGFILIMAPTGILNLESLINYLDQNILNNFSSNITLVLIGLLIILLCLRYIQKMILNSRQNKNISFESKEGKVKITLVAIEDLLKKMIEQRDEISHIKVKVRLKKKIIAVQIKGYLNYEVNLVNLTKEIQEKVKERIGVLLGEDKKVEINLQIRKITVSGDQEKAEEPEIPFRHYE
ncbi:MAG: alkaline shock response membrane anchor protein AmaP [Candidatus Omnitrophica bacterium]|nr:alkaline shock response membrane anchor protein AmaP [Candidatus Omnitrophota bacterium]MCF7877219.1 alkaline shock response membrane anchor protein AmaP [Candidatus Omnitrophota bacterium]MCF7878074.1 alkaline shock response membrane anchor protein AmaP [Candidatus Omnitrophota bacterium]MCF7892755.1 alkaline shock response membrane anchor protein AmaP [Candidatus Omnitrophota bacterium]